MGVLVQRKGGEERWQCVLWVLVELVIRECLVSVFFFLVQGDCFSLFSLFFMVFSFSFLSVLSSFSSPELHLYL
jgi:hypothetical protein